MKSLSVLGSKSLAALAAWAAVAVSASAAPLSYSTSFTSTDGFSDAQLNGQNSWVAHPNHDVSDSAGVGLVDHVNAAGPVHLDSSGDLTSELALGKTITLTLNANFVGNFANQNNGRWVLGIDDSATASQPLLGGGFFFNNGGSNFFIGDETLSNPSKVDTGIVFDSAFHTLTTEITRSAVANTFDVTVDLDGVSTAFSVVDAGLWTGASTAYAGFRWQGNQAGNVDSFSVSSIDIPEPTSLLLLGVACVGSLARHRRTI